MIPKKDTYSIVLLGQWNPSIFDADWVSSNLASSKDSAITIAFPIDDPTAPRKIDFDNLSLYPGRKKLHIATQVYDESGIKNCSRVLQKILNLLEHTPVSHCGLNFGFFEQNRLEKVHQPFNFSDSNDIPRDYDLVGTDLRRRFLLKDGMLNLTLVESVDEGGIEIQFNFHYELNSLEKYKNLISEEHVAGRYGMALDFCKKVYDLELVDEGVSDE